MRLLDKYIGREVASHSLLGLAVFTFVFFVPQMVRLMDLVVRHSGGVGTVSLLFLCSLTPALAFSIPMAVLVGVLIGLGRLSADSEIVALHASGISLRRLLLPIGVVALACAFGTMILTFWVSPAAIRTLRNLEERVLSSQAPFAVQPRVFDERFPKFILYVQDVEAAATPWRGVFLASQAGATAGLFPPSANQTRQSSVTIAEDAQIVATPAQHQIDIHLGSGSTHEYDQYAPDQYNVTTFGETDLPVDISAGSASPLKNTALSKAEEPATALLSDKGGTWLASRIEFERRIAFPAACIVFALLGVPMGVRPRRGGRAGGLILTLVLVGAYYLLFVSGDHMAAQGRISPFIGVWAGNIVAIIVGIVMLARVENIRRPSRIISWLESVWVRSKKAVNPTLPNGTPAAALPAVGLRQALAARRAMAFPMLVDVYLLQQFFYFFFVLLAAFVLIFDAFTLFDLLGDIARNHVPTFTVLSYFRYLIPQMVYQLAPLATLVA